LTRSGEWAEVEGVTEAVAAVTVYNCRIAEHHTYFVRASAAGVWLWAHNDSCPVAGVNGVFGEGEV
jgi:hypothetical protein